MLTISELRELTSMPTMSDISLKLLLEFYESTLSNNIFNYQLKDSTENEFSVKLSFYSPEFCHLLGLHYIQGNGSTLIQGKRGCDSIKNESVTFKTLKAVNAESFGKIKDRIRFFPFVYQLLHDPSIIQFNPSVVDGNSLLKCDLIFHKSDFLTKRIHLGIENKGNNEYFPKTYMIEKNNGTKYIANQKPLTIVDFNIETK